MNLSKRLQAVAAMLVHSKTVADIGSDHAYLPVALITSGTASFVVAGEVRQGPLAAARQTIKAAGLEDRIDARAGDGLQVLAPGEVDAVVIAGMGSGVIRGILERSPAVTSRLQRLVCQPMAGASQLRQWLLQHGWRLVEEDLVLEEGRLYEILAAERGDMAQPEPLLLEIGPLLWQQKHPLLKEHLERLLLQAAKKNVAMAHSNNPAVWGKMQVCQEKIRALEEKIRCVSTAE